MDTFLESSFILPHIQGFVEDGRILLSDRLMNNYGKQMMLVVEWQ
jgi:hypothetical protein